MYQGIPVPLKHLRQQRYDAIKEALTFSNGAYFQAQKRGLSVDGIPQYLHAYREDHTHLYLPRHTPWTELSLDSFYSAKQHKAPMIEPVTPHVQLRPEQRTVYIAYADHVEAGEDGILSLAPGRGKTVLSVLVWSSLQRPVPGLAIVTTLTIAKQWIGARGVIPQGLLGFTDIQESDIGMVGDGRSDWKGKKFVIATVQSLAKKVMPKEFYDYFGVIFFDECHRLGAPSFSAIGGLFPGIRIGLSATWERADRLERLFMLHLGPLFYEDRAQSLKPDVYFVRTPITLDLKKFRMWGRGRQQSDINHARVITYLSRLPERHELILKLIHDARARERKILVLGDRKEELLALSAHMPHNDWGICVGSLDGRAMPHEMQKRALRKSIIFATSQLVKEGLDQPDIDTLIVLYPQSNAAFAEQAAGRILRQMPEKQHPTIVVLCDSGLYIDEVDTGWGANYRARSFPLKRTCERMQQTFRKLEFEIKRAVK